MEVEIVVRDEGEIIAKRTANTWESAEEDLGKLERVYNRRVVMSPKEDPNYRE